MGEWIFHCWACQTKAPMHERIRRKDSCPHCLADMHACKNCRFHQPTAHNQCIEPQADYVTDKERSNFCQMFEAHSGPHPSAPDTAAARAKLEALFGK